MIFEDLLENVFSMFSPGSVDLSQVDSYVGAVGTLLSYIDYFDAIIPVNLLLGCSFFILGWTIICVVIRLCIEFFT